MPYYPPAGGGGGSFNPHAPGPIGDVTPDTIAASTLSVAGGDFSVDDNGAVSAASGQSLLNLDGSASFAGGSFEVTPAGKLTLGSDALELIDGTSSQSVILNYSNDGAGNFSQFQIGPAFGTSGGQFTNRGYISYGVTEGGTGVGDITGGHVFDSSVVLLNSANIDLSTGGSIKDSNGSLGISGANLSFVAGGAGGLFWSGRLPYSATATLLANTATIASVVTFTPAAIGTFRIGVNVTVTQVSAGVLTITATFKDVNGTAQTVTLFPQGVTTAGISTTGQKIFPTADIPANSTQAIVVTATLTIGTMTYDIGATIQQVN